MHLDDFHPGHGGKLWKFEILKEKWTNFNEPPGDLVANSTDVQRRILCPILK